MADKTTSEKLVDNVIITLVARGAMILATGLILPLGLWMAQRGVSTIDEISKKIDVMRDQSFETQSSIKSLQQMQNAQSGFLADHEARVRVLESINRAAATRNNP